MRAFLSCPKYPEMTKMENLLGDNHAPGPGNALIIGRFVKTLSMLCLKMVRANRGTKSFSKIPNHRCGELTSWGLQAEHPEEWSVSKYPRPGDTSHAFTVLQHKRAYTHSGTSCIKCNIK